MTKARIAAAIYCRRSTDQGGTDENRSVVRQEHLARTICRGARLAVRPEHVYVDDGISGAEFEKRPGLASMRAAAPTAIR